MRVALMLSLVACGGGGSSNDSPKPDGREVDAAPDGPGASCTGAPGTVTVKTQPGQTVVFHDPSGAIVSSGVATTGTATETLPPCSMISVAKPKGVVTITDVMPGETIVVGMPKPTFTDLRGVQITFPSDAEEFRAGQCTFNAGNSPVNLQVSKECRNSSTGNIDLVVLTREGVDNHITKFANVSVAPLGSATVAAMRTDFSSATVNVSGTDGFANVHLRSVGDRIDIGAKMSLLSPTGTINYVPFGTHLMREVHTQPTDEVLYAADMVAQPLTAITFDVGTEFSNRVTSVTATTGMSPTVTWTTTSATADVAIACLEWFNVGEHEWCAYVDPHRTSFKFPALPANLLPATPYESVGAAIEETSVFDGYAALRLDPINVVGLSNNRYPANLRYRRAIWIPALYESWSL